MRFFSLTLVLLASILPLDVLFGFMNRKAEIYSLACYARTFQKVTIFLGFSYTVRRSPTTKKKKGQIKKVSKLRLTKIEIDFIVGSFAQQ